MKKRTGLWVVAVVVAFFVGYQAGGVNLQKSAINTDILASPMSEVKVAYPTETPFITATPTIESTLVPTTIPQPTEQPTATGKVTPIPTPTPTPSLTPVPTPRPTPVPTPEPTHTPEIRNLTSGHRGDDVLALQERLVELGFNVGSPDVQFGGKTSTAVKAVQAMVGLKVTGIVDEDTRSIIWSDAAPTAQPKPTAKPTPTPKPIDEDDPSDYQSDYILNKNTKKFHETWCSSVDQMEEKNKVYYTGTSAGARAKGYSPCKNCNP